MTKYRPRRLRFLVHSTPAQSVDYRLHIVSWADTIEVTGWVRNLPNGNTEGQAQGTGVHLVRFLRALEDGPDRDQAVRFEYHEIAVVKGEAGFQNIKSGEKPPPPVSRIRIHFLVHTSTVQDFRMQIVAWAESLENTTGWVRHLPDGKTHEGEAQGPGSSLVRLLGYLERMPIRGTLVRVDHNEIAVVQGEKGFRYVRSGEEPPGRMEGEDIGEGEDMGEADTDGGKELDEELKLTATEG
ncbi:hypothetical protein EDC01DRAFT_656551 [Geopyxis carbonaria]|nr:hypothetical protein EDC01DRAFT_656551 [Geopyxis carbonaria]